MNSATNKFLHDRFNDYYKKTNLAPPSSLENREWGFVMFDAELTMRMHRHIGFQNIELMSNYIKNTAPRHIYYSTAYYEKPDASTMQDKNWLGADLVFDLDADHIMKGAYDKMLSRVKEETEKLLSMLTLEFGIDPKTIEIVFSGGRGYHIHVKDLAFRGWGSSERRELIDYVCGVGIDPNIMLSMRNPTPVGWPMRYRRALLDYLQWLKSLPEEESSKHLLSMEGIGKESISTYLKKQDEIINKIKSNNTIDLTKNKVIEAISQNKSPEFHKYLLAHAALADEPVTTDTKRLIRMPLSLHGGSGMQVQSLNLKNLHDYDPLVNAVIFKDREINVNSSVDITMTMMENNYKINKGIIKVPEAVGIFLCCRDMAEIS